MKHYAKENGYELDMFHYRRCFKYKDKSLAKTKHIYRKRERRILKRMTAELVDEETFDYLEAERDYALRCYEQAMSDYVELCEAEASIRDAGAWSVEFTKLFAMSYREIRNRSNAAYLEWWNAA